MFSVIIPTYNSEYKIEKTLDKLLKQLPSLDDEIIVVNDGSEDQTRQKLKQYEKNNQVKIIHKINSGVSAARNVGIAHTNLNTQYITFVDDSDSISDNFFTVAQNFFDKYPKIFIASIPIISSQNQMQINHTIGASTKKTIQICDIINQPKELQYHIGGVVFKKELFEKEHYFFDENINYWEDAKLINTILLDKRYYGVLQNAKYYYDRKDKNSLSQIAWRYHYRYSPQIINNYIPLIQKSIKNYGKVLEYIQYLVVNHYISYIQEHNQPLLVDKFIFEDHLFKDKSNELFDYINTKVIDKLNFPNRYKAFLYYIKGLKFPNELHIKNSTIYMHKYHFFKKELYFSLSHNAYGFSKETAIYVRKINGKLCYAKLLSIKSSNLLGEEIFDISKCMYKIKFSVIALLFGTNFYISDQNNDKITKINSIPILKRLFSNFVKR